MNNKFLNDEDILTLIYKIILKHNLQDALGSSLTHIVISELMEIENYEVEPLKIRQILINHFPDYVIQQKRRMTNYLALLESLSYAKEVKSA